MSGSPQKDFLPRIITSRLQEKEQMYSLFTVSMETNPLDGTCDTRFRIKARPLEISYDVVSLIGLLLVFMCVSFSDAFIYFVWCLKV